MLVCFAGNGVLYILLATERLVTEIRPISFRPVTQSALANSADCADVLAVAAVNSRLDRVKDRFIVSSISRSPKGSPLLTSCQVAGRTLLCTGEREWTQSCVKQI